MRPEAGTSTGREAGALAHRGHVLAGEPAAEHIHWLDVVPVDGADVAQVRGVGPMVGEDAGDVLVVLGEPDRLGVEDVLNGEVEPAVPGEERADSEWTVVLGGVVHRGSAVLALPGQAMPASSYHLAGLNTCQVHDHRPVATTPALTVATPRGTGSASPL